MLSFNRRCAPVRLCVGRHKFPVLFNKTTENVFLASNFQIYVSYSVSDRTNRCVLFLRNNVSLGSITPVMQARSTTTFIYIFTVFVSNLVSVFATISFPEPKLP